MQSWVQNGLVLVALLVLGACAEETAVPAITGPNQNAPATNAKSPVDLVVEGRWVVTMDAPGTIIEHGAIAIKDGKIIAIGPDTEIKARYLAVRTLNGEEKVLMPGLVNGHTHAAMVLFRGMVDDLKLIDWLQNYVFPMEGLFVSPKFVKTGAELACYEMLSSGTTSIVDMYFYPDVSGEVFERCGLRAILGAPMIDYPSPGFTGWDDSYAAGVDYVKRQQGKSDRITPALAPHAPYTVSPDHLRQVVESAGQIRAPITMHLAESPGETAMIADMYGTSSVRHVAKLGMLDMPLIAAHMVWPDEEEIAMLASSKVSAIHNPTSNMKLGSGISPVPAMLKAGVRVGLGTDGAASNNDLDMWEEIRLAALLHKVGSGDPTAMPAITALRLATSMGAEAIGLGTQTGSLEVGKMADMIQVDMSGVRLAPVYDVISHLVYVTDSQDVTTTIIDGRIVYLDGKVLTLKGEQIRSAANAMGREIAEALANQPAKLPAKLPADQTPDEKQH